MWFFPRHGMRCGSSCLPPLSRSVAPVVCVGTETWEVGVAGERAARPGPSSWNSAARPILPLAVPLSKAATPLAPRIPWSLSCPGGWGQIVWGRRLGRATSTSRLFPHLPSTLGREPTAEHSRPHLLCHLPGHARSPQSLACLRPRV